MIKYVKNILESLYLLSRLVVKISIEILPFVWQNNFIENSHPTFEEKEAWKKVKKK